MASLAKSLVYLLLLLYFPVSQANFNNEDKNGQNSSFLTLGVFPFLSTHTLVKRYTLLADYLSEQLEVEVVLETAQNFNLFLKRTNSEKRYDILITAPHFYYLAQQKANYRAVARIDAPRMSSVIAVPNNSPIKSLIDLRNRTISTVHKTALSTAMLRAHLRHIGLDPDKDVALIETPTHNASILSAYKEITDATSLMKFEFNRTSKAIKNNMRIIATTRNRSAHMPISVAPWLSQDQTSKIESAFLYIDSSEQGKKALRSVRWPGVIKASPDEYSDLNWAIEQIDIN